MIKPILLTVALSLCFAVASIAAPITGMRILPRQDYPGSNIKTYRVESSADGVTFREVASGEFPADLQAQTVSFPADGSRFFRLVGLSSRGQDQNASVAEINLLAGEAVVSRSAWKITADSEAAATGDAYGPAAFAMDGNPATCWHTAWPNGITPYPHSLLIDTAFRAPLVLNPAGETLIWEPVPLVTNYELAYGPEGGELTRVAPSSRTEVTVKDLIPGAWSFKVRALSQSGVASPWSATITETFLAAPTPPAAPTGLRVLK